MDYFNLPLNTVIQRIVPKNTFDPYTTTKQKELFTKEIAKITWTHCLSKDTTNLPGKDIQEIQIFSIELKERKEIKNILDIIDKAVPYHIIFIIECEETAYLSVSAKHPSPLNETKSIIDWTFKSTWFSKTSNQYRIELKRSLDYVFYNFCEQLSLKQNKEIKTLADLWEYNKQISSLIKEIEHLKKKIATCEQFNRKIELNLKLKKLENDLKNI